MPERKIQFNFVQCFRTVVAVDHVIEPVHFAVTLEVVIVVKERFEIRAEPQPWSEM